MRVAGPDMQAGSTLLDNLQLLRQLQQAESLLTSQSDLVDGMSCNSILQTYCMISSRYSHTSIVHATDSS